MILDYDDYVNKMIVTFDEKFVKVGPLDINDRTKFIELSKMVEQR